jgi:GAF domain-containing protein
VKTTSDREEGGLLEPIPESREAAAVLGERPGGADLLEGLQAVARAAVRLVPSCIGVSVTVVVDGEPSTLTATSEAVASVDAAQYLDGGPCVQAADTGEATAVDDVLDERRWQLFDCAASAQGVRSSLSMPFTVADAGLPGALNLYAADPNAFANQEELARVFGVQVSDLVRNADLSFLTRDFARQLPDRLREEASIDRAIGALATARGWDPDEAEIRLRTAANQAGVPVSKVADVVLSLDIS